MILLVVGTALTMTTFGDAVILNAYAVYFLLALPLTRLRARTLAITAAALAVVGPQVAFGLRTLLGESALNSINAYDPLERLCGVGVLDLLLTGFYPAITWMPFVIAGMALDRLDLAAGAVQRRLAVLGPALIVLGYGTSWLALKIFGGASRTACPRRTPCPTWQPAPCHRPASGASSPTPGRCWRPNATPPDANSTVLWCVFVIGAVVFAAVWSRFFRRGPLEYLLNNATKGARLVR